MKKITSLLLAMTLLLSLTACTKGGLDFNPATPEPSTPPSSAPVDDDLIYPENGLALGYVGDTLRTAWFDMTLDSAYTTHEFDDLETDEGYKFLVLNITLYNSSNYTVPMFDTDFWVEWDVQEGENEEDAWAYPLYDQDGDEYITASDLQLPIEYELSIRETRSGILLFVVPETCTDYFLGFTEYYENETEGDTFYVRFSAPLSQG